PARSLSAGVHAVKLCGRAPGTRYRLALRSRPGRSRRAAPLAAPRRHPPRNRAPTLVAQVTPDIGLALSGGGSRAAAFHLGCLRALSGLGLLPRVRVLSGISGGAL